jgi:galactokinase
MSDTTDTAELFVPGRLCLFGEHSDWAAQFGRHAGHCLVIGTDQGLTATARPSDRFVVESLIPDARGRASDRKRRMECAWREEVLLSAARDELEFFRYCAGVAHQMMTTYPQVTGGLDLEIRGMDLPLRRGVSSSAAVCILVAKAFDAVYDLCLFPHELMEQAYLGERLTGSQCGRMDQACIYGKTPVLLTLGKGADIRVEPIFSERPVHMLFVDLGGRKDTLRILEDLRGAYLTSKPLQNLLGPGNEQIIRRACRALSDGDARGLGALMTEAQALFDAAAGPLCPEELQSPLLHQLLAMDELGELVWGGKGVGSQGDGTAQFIARSADDRDQAMRLIEQTHPDMKCFPLTITVQRNGQPT